MPIPGIEHVGRGAVAEDELDVRFVGGDASRRAGVVKIAGTEFAAGAEAPRWELAEIPFEPFFVLPVGGFVHSENDGVAEEIEFFVRGKADFRMLCQAAGHPGGPAFGDSQADKVCFYGT